VGSDYTKHLADSISRHRRRRGLTQQQLANRLGVSYQAVSKWENGQTCPEITLLPLLADIFQVTLDELFGRDNRTIDLKQGLIAEYLFNGGPQDSSGNGQHAQVHGAVLCADRFGQPASAYVFDGVDDYLVLNPAPSLNADAFSVSVWCCYDANSKQEGWNGAIVSQHGQHKNYAFQLSTYDAQITCHRFLIDPDLSVAKPLQREFWYHIVVTYEHETFRLYKNGRLECEQAGVFQPDPNEPMYIGRKASDEPYFFFNGRIDDLRLYERALNEEEIQALYLDQGWEPQQERVLPVIEEKDYPLLDYVDHVQMLVSSEHITALAEWSKSQLGFRSLIEHPGHFYLLSLGKSAGLLLHGRSEPPLQPQITPFVFKTRRPVNEVTQHLTDVGASIVDIRDEGFASFITFIDPFGYRWMIIRET
jgi:Predicted transcriptional regulators